MIYSILISAAIAANAGFQSNINNSSILDTFTNLSESIQNYMFRFRYKEVISKINDINNKLDRLQIISWINQHPKYIYKLLNISTAYSIIDIMFNLCHDLIVGDIVPEEFKNSMVCVHSVVELCVYNESANHTKLNNCSLYEIKEGWKIYSSNQFNKTNPSTGEYVFMGNKCVEWKALNETNIKGYIEYKNAYLNNDDKWLKSKVDKIIYTYRHSNFTSVQDYVRKFNEKYYIIHNNQHKLYSLFKKELTKTNLIRYAIKWITHD